MTAADHATTAGGFTDRANRVRKRIPFAYWLAYDLVVAPFLIWGTLSLSWAFLAPLAMLAVAAFFDINEAIVKWAEHRTRTTRQMRIPRKRVDEPPEGEEDQS